MMVTYGCCRCTDRNQYDVLHFSAPSPIISFWYTKYPVFDYIRPPAPTGDPRPGHMHTSTLSLGAGSEASCSQRILRPHRLVEWSYVLSQRLFSRFRSIYLFYFHHPGSRPSYNRVYISPCRRIPAERREWGSVSVGEPGLLWLPLVSPSSNPINTICTLPPATTASSCFARKVCILPLPIGM